MDATSDLGQTQSKAQPDTTPVQPDLTPSVQPVQNPVFNPNAPYQIVTSAPTKPTFNPNAPYQTVQQSDKTEPTRFDALAKIGTPIVNKAIDYGGSLVDAIKESGLGQQVAMMMTEPQDAREHAIQAIGGPAALPAYRMSKGIVDQAENMFTAPRTNFLKARQDFARAVNDFHNKDLRNFLSSVGSTAGDFMELMPGPADLGGKVREQSEELRPGGKPLKPLLRNLIDVATLALGGEEAEASAAGKEGAISKVAGGVKDLAQEAKLAAEDAKSAVEGHIDSLKPNPDEAAQKALSPSKKKAIQTQKNLEGARPYLEGAENLEDLQSKIKPAKTEVWAPYEKAVDGPVGDTVVVGPDGEKMSTRDLEAERLKTSADLDSVRRLNPSDRQTQLQKEGAVKELTERYRNIVDTLDPVLEKAGIDPKLIRLTHGQLTGVQKLIEGRNTLTEISKKYGLGKILNIDVAHPFNNLSNVAEGVKDLVTGRPAWSGKPTDVAVREGFREGTGGPKPNLEPGIPKKVNPDVKVESKE